MVTDVLILARLPIAASVPLGSTLSTVFFKKNFFLTKKQKKIIFLAVNLGKKIAVFRRARNLSINELARQARVDVASVWRMEAGQRNVGIKSLQKILSALGLAEGSNTYKDCLGLWLQEKSQLVTDPQRVLNTATSGLKTSKKRALQLLERAAQLPPRDFKIIEMLILNDDIRATVRQILKLCQQKNSEE
jgi:transcriptional regulator with XRE-family HTH domain